MMKIKSLLKSALSLFPRAPWQSVAPYQLGSYQAVFAEPRLSESEKQTVDSFADLYYSKLDSGRGLHTIVLSWLGYEMLKCPMDLWIYQELLFRERPDFIVETGTYKGGSALYLATVCDLIGNGQVLTVDIDASHQPNRPSHPRITYIHGSSIDDEIFKRISAETAGRKVMVILDGDHRCETVLKELNLYSQIVRPGGYLIVEDTNINGHPTYPDFGPGPWEAAEQFLSVNDKFQVDMSCERFLLTMNPRGFLRRKANG